MGKLRINWGVAGFFVFYFFVLQFFNDWQYRRYLDDGNSWLTFKARLCSTPLQCSLIICFTSGGRPFCLKGSLGLFFCRLSCLLFFLNFIHCLSIGLLGVFLVILTPVIQKLV